jgi:chorismate synthase
MGSLRYLTAGESHGEMLIGILDGVPSGLPLVASRDIDPVLAERQKGYGRGRRQQIENDRARIVSGVRFGVTTGAPIGIILQNRDWDNWREKMSVEPTETEVKRVTVPRPGHADLAGALKYGHESDMRNVLERASARETAMRVAIGAVASRLLHEIGVESVGYVVAIGGISAQIASEFDVFSAKDMIAASPVRMPNNTCEADVLGRIDLAKSNGDTLGGVVECIIRGVPAGVGSHVQWDRKLDGILAQAVMSIQAVKAVEIGAGTKASASFGSEVHDAIATDGADITRRGNNAGGIEGGMSNGEPIMIRAHMKPISTLMQPLGSVDLESREAREAHIERSDVCAVPALSVIVENVAALTVASEILDTFGGDTMDEVRRRVADRRSLLAQPRAKA